MADSNVDAEFAVIGAGAAGLAAFAALRSAGRDALLLEARDRIGGRIHQDYPPRWPLPVELGAEFIHGSPRELEGLVEAAPGPPLEAWSATPEGLRRAGEGDAGADAVLDRMGRIAAPVPDCSFTEFLASCTDVGEAARARVRSFIEGFEAADPDRISVYSLNRERSASAEGKTGEPCRPRGGYSQLIVALSAAIRDSPVDRVWLRTPVRRIRWRAGEAEIAAETIIPGTELREPRVWRVRRVIVTLPLSLLQRGFEPDGRDEEGGTQAGARSEPQGVLFEPRLDAKRQALSRLVMGSAQRVVVRLREPVWEQAHGADGASLKNLGFLFGAEPGLRFPVWWTAPGSVKGAAQITGWSAGHRAAGLAGLDRDTVRRIALDELSRLLRLAPEAVAAQVLETHTHDWQSDPWSRGAYSYAQVGGLDAPADLAAPLEKTLYFAGEATDDTGQHATVQGAIRSGRRAAREAMGK